MAGPGFNPRKDPIAFSFCCCFLLLLFAGIKVNELMLYSLSGTLFFAYNVTDLAYLKVLKVYRSLFCCILWACYTKLTDCACCLLSTSIREAFCRLGM
jgi:hypothetical protein